MYDDYYRNYNPYSTYQNSYDKYVGYESNFDSMDNDYERFMTRQVDTMPYNYDSIKQSNASPYTYDDISNMYPEIYKLILPIIDKKLNLSTVSSINNDTLTKLTFDVYDEVTKTDIGKKLNIQVNTINTGCRANTQTSTAVASPNSVSGRQGYNFNSNSQKISNQGMNKCQSSNLASSRQNSGIDNVKEVSSKPVRSNCLLCDLIKIMILNKLLERNRFPKSEIRPPFINNQRPPRPVMPFNSPYSSPNNMSRPVANIRPPSYFDMPYPEDYNY